MERRYDDDEIREIFDRATRVDEPATPARAGDAPSTTGMTLAELQEIGREAGIAPDQVARAAAQLDRGAPVEVPPLRRFGVPLSVSRIVELPARLSEEDWDHLVVRLRDVFRARGQVSREGTLRSWSNGNLQVLMEPTRSGYRLRMRTLSADLRGRVAAGAALGTMGAGIGALGLVFASGDAMVAVPGVAFIMGIGVFMFGSAALKAPRWRAERAAQFEEIGALAWELAEDRRLAAPRDDESLPPGRSSE